MKIGEVAAKSGFSIVALRYYEEIGLIPVPQRINGRRTYNESIFRYLNLIRMAKGLGFSLEEIRDTFMIENQNWREKSEQQIIFLKHQIVDYQQRVIQLEQVVKCNCETPLTCSKIAL